jgi:hypothetical protein
MMIMKWILLGAVTAVMATAAPRITYSKSFPGSTPALVFITLDPDGQVVYKESLEDDFPIKMGLRKEEADLVFALAAKVDYFKRPLESGLPVARMGEKMLRWEEDGKAPNEVKFNYSLDADAKLIHEWFEKMTETAQHYIALERSVKFDKLGVNKALLQFQAAMDRGHLVGLEVFLPLLDRVIKNDSYLHMARERAGVVAEFIRKPKTAAATAPEAATAAATPPGKDEKH